MGRPGVEESDGLLGASPLVADLRERGSWEAQACQLPLSPLNNERTRGRSLQAALSYCHSGLGPGSRSSVGPLDSGSSPESPMSVATDTTNDEKPLRCVSVTLSPPEARQGSKANLSEPGYALDYSSLRASESLMVVAATVTKDEISVLSAAVRARADYCHPDPDVSGEGSGAVGRFRHGLVLHERRARPSPDSPLASEDAVLSLPKE